MLEENNNLQPNDENKTEEVSPETPLFGSSNTDISLLNHLSDKIKHEIQKIIVGQDDMIDLLLIALLSDGHVLLEGVPGIAKTLTARLLAKTLQTDFSRIQFTPDLMPSDVTGTNVFNMKESHFDFIQGPIFSNIVLIDEINRAPAKTQASLFEVMEEKQVTVDGITYKMEYPFFAIATQNPVEQEGTYRLPEAQLDRFMFKIIIDYPSLLEEKRILYRFQNDFNQTQIEDVRAVLSVDELRKCRSIIEQVKIKEELLDYIAAIVHSTRNHPDLFLGASPRASFAIMKTAKTVAAMNNRDFVIPEDIQFVAYPVLNHRIILTPDREMEGYTSDEVIKDVIKKIEIPR